MHVHQILNLAPHIDDFTTAEPAVVALAKATDASEVRRCCRPLQTPTTLNTWIGPASSNAPNAASDCRPAPTDVGITGLLDEVDGAVLAETLAAFTQPRDTHDKATPAQRRADALAAIANAAATNQRPLGCPRCRFWWIWRICRRAPTRV